MFYPFLKKNKQEQTRTNVLGQNHLIFVPALFEMILRYLYVKHQLVFWPSFLTIWEGVQHQRNKIEPADTVKLFWICVYAIHYIQKDPKNYGFLRFVVCAF